MATTQRDGSSALCIAYKAVLAIGYTHSKLEELSAGVNYPTLRNIRDGKNVKKVTERFYLNLFIGLIHKEYELRIGNGGNGATSLLKVQEEILLALVR